MKQIKYI